MAVQQGAGGSHALIVVAEPDAHVRRLQRYFLESGGFEVEFAFDGEEGLERARQRHPSILVTEILLRKKDGLSVCRALKADPATQDIKVLVFSVLAAEDRARQSGADLFLRKPLDDVALIRAVQFYRTGPNARVSPWERISSGNADLDRVLNGGFPANAIHIVMGSPGSGKTILAEQLAFENATRERPALYLTTFSEPLPKFLTFLQEYAFADPSCVGSEVLYEDLGESLDEKPRAAFGARRRARSATSAQGLRHRLLQSNRRCHAGPRHVATSAL